MDAIISHGAVPGTSALVNEPNLLVQNISATPQRTETRYKGPNRATQGITETDPVMDIAINAIVSEDAGLAIGHPGTQVLELQNFQDEMHGFNPLEGLMLFRDPSRQLDTENPDAISFTVTHFPFVRNVVNPGWLTLTGITDPVIPVGGHVLVRSDTQNSRPTWFKTPDWLINHNDGKWNINGTGYSANKTSDALSPLGLTGWTVTTGTGQPVLAGSSTDPT